MSLLHASELGSSLPMSNYRAFAPRSFLFFPPTSSLCGPPLRFALPSPSYPLSSTPNPYSRCQASCLPRYMYRRTSTPDSRPQTSLQRPEPQHDTTLETRYISRRVPDKPRSCTQRLRCLLLCESSTACCLIQYSCFCLVSAVLHTRPGLDHFVLHLVNPTKSTFKRGS